MHGKDTDKQTAPQKGKSRFLSALFFAKDISGVGSARVRSPLYGRLGRATDRIFETLSYSSTRFYGYAATSFGLISLLMHLVRYYLETNPTVEASTLIASAVFAIIGIPLIFADKPMCIALQDFPPTDFVLFEFFSIKRMRREASVKALPPIVGILLGAVPAVFAFFFGIAPVVGILVTAVFVAISLVSPEFPFLFLLLAIPYVKLIPYSPVVIAALVLLILISFFRKVAVGKRVYVFGISDVMILFLVAVIIGFGVIGGGRESTVDSWLTAALTLAYIPAANMVVNRRLADCAVNAIIASAAPASVYSVTCYVINLARGERAPSSAFMSTPAAFAAFLLAALVLSLMCAKELKGGKRALYLLNTLLCILALVTTEYAPVLISLVVLIPAYIIVVHTELVKELLIIVYAIPVVFFLLPADALYAISSAFDMPLTLGEMRAGFIASLSLFGENVFTGVGADGAPTVMNTVIGFACRFGVFAIIVLFLIVVLRLRQVSVYSRYLKSSALEGLSDMTLLSMFALLAVGWFYDIGADFEMHLLFFVIFGLSTASLRVSKKEYDDSLGYFGDNISVESSAADITIRK